SIIARRKELSELYDKLLLGQNLQLTRPAVREHTEYNYAYYPVVFEDEKTLVNICDALNASFIYPRRYFYPSLSALPYVKKYKVPVAESISPRVMCLPLYHDLKTEDIHRICDIVKKILKFK
ncbi:MAG TPA: DegT/DnrJ/EryC1/StrS family aminotransferase, partial [Chitinophagales bacterium]|nr:DegT/DnrJ/EryC1/StrS family aminotransferase [Chitinophagales bacterium]